ncbi:SusC/RagA family TonB-linked outer membrane protein [Mucilaginibacter robiniae]|uniref:SusC/RagA family TonB-linked outer membrane protein n=1 Tax=Mucilaginibacter robiniae TaxID=2728022 RepID=A0A7L5E3K3_9SPHI|nr:SusC/RagA family TonB-linked outer membrane protein [Mucilaginibacter robiniae]QJD96234.1 SusC/RagA family TonB-linked outer membrane protein [Mucilaginibacter robiniae]
MFAAVRTLGQNVSETQITFSAQQESLKAALQHLQDQSGFNIFYPSARVNEIRNINISRNQRTVAETLNLLLEGSSLTYRQQGHNIILFEQPVTSTENSLPAQPPMRIIGLVLDEDGQPLPGVTIRSKMNRAISTATDANGHFHLDVESENDILIFTFVGYKTQEVSVTGKTSVQVKLLPLAGSLDEVQVIGYSTTTRRDNTGAVSSITAKDLGKETVDNPLTALQGRIAGMQITQDNGLPGAGVRVNIRGGGNGVSSAGFVPLYVVDGVPFTLFNGGSPASDNLNAYGTSGANGGVSPFSVIAPEDIERIDVLKDADATSIYGSRGSNGVILITTKKGRQGKTAFNFNVYSGITNVNHYIPMMNTAEYLALRRAAFTNAGVTPTAANALDLTTWDPNAYTDWQKWAIGETGHTTNANASVSGGDAQNTFLFTSTYRKQGTVYRGDYGATTFSGRLNAGHRSKDGRFSIDASGNYSYEGTNLPSTDLSTIYNLPPNYPLYNTDGSLNWTLTNPLAYLLRTTKAQTTNLITNLNLGYRILPGLMAKANLGYTFTRLKQQATNPASSQNPANSTNSTLVYTDNDNSNYIIEPQLEYLKSISQGKLQALVGSTFQQTKATGVYLTGSGYTNEALLNSLVAASNITTSYNNNSTYKYNAVFARLNYNWEDKYIIDGTFRRDGSSRFGENHRFGNFWATGASWIFTQESFMKNVNFLSFGKLRGSYGVTGNDQIPNYQYYALYSTTGTTYSYNGTATYTPSNIANPNLRWETTRKLDLALELGFLKDRILLKADYYRNRTYNPLNYMTTPSQIGTTGYSGNLDAVVQNKGWEFELTSTNIAAKDFRWVTNLNLTFNRNKLLSFKDLATSSYKTTYIIGQPTNITQLYHYTGVNPQTGLPTFQDKNSDGTIAFADDRYVAPYGHPYYGGITNTLTYKSLQLDFTFQYNHRYGYKNSTLSSNPYGYSYTNQSTAILNRWMQPGDMAFFPAASVTSNTAYSTLGSSDYNWGDASYLKLKTVNITYSLPKSWISHAKLSSASVYLQGQNIFTWAKQKYTYDPDTTVPGTGSGLGTGQYLALPQLRTLVIGLNCTF